MNIYKEALESMVWQFAYRGTREGKPILYNGGLSALEEAFGTLGWENPHVLEDSASMDGVTCDVAGCMEFTVAQGGMWADTGYWCLCEKHSPLSRQGNKQPEMKQRALDREARRDPVTRCLPSGK